MCIRDRNLMAGPGPESQRPAPADASVSLPARGTALAMTRKAWISAFRVPEKEHCSSSATMRAPMWKPRSWFGDSAMPRATRHARDARGGLDPGLWLLFFFGLVYVVVVAAVRIARVTRVARHGGDHDDVD